MAVNKAGRYVPLLFNKMKIPSASTEVEQNQWLDKKFPELCFALQYMWDNRLLPLL